jgi:hypothetical protein
MDLDLQSTLLAYEHTMRADPFNVGALCEIGKSLNQLKRTQEARKCQKAAVDALKRAIRAKDADLALQIEARIYTAFVRTVEDENHYYRCFSEWREDMARLGRQLRSPQPTGGDPDRIAFYVHTGYILGHTEVLFKMLENIPPDRAANLMLRIYVLAEFDQAFLNRAKKIGVAVIAIATCMPSGDSSTWLERFLYLRDRLREDNVGVCVWVSAPDMAAFGLSLRLAPVQIFWALRFHPITGSYIDGYITYGAKHERKRVFGKQEWAVCPVPLAIDSSPVDAVAKTNLRASFPEKFLLGTLARADKIDSAPFLSCVTEILQQHPGAGYLWTGKSRHTGIDRYFRDAGIADRCHFVGWVDTRLYASMLDLFLETFPFGCGVTGYQALGFGTPLLSYFAPNTVFGMQYWHEFSANHGDHAAGGATAVTEEALAKYPVLCAKDPVHYVALAGKIIDDPSFRAAAAEAGQWFFEKEINNTRDYSARFFDTIAEIARKKLAVRTNATTPS